MLSLLFKLVGHSSAGYYNTLSWLIPVLCLMFGGSMFFLFSFIVVFLLVMCPEDMKSVFRDGLRIVFKSFQAVKSAVKSLVLPKKKRRRVRKSHQVRHRRFWRRHLPYCLVQRCRTRHAALGLLGPCVRQHWRWRRRTTKYKI